MRSSSQKPGPQDTPCPTFWGSPEQGTRRKRGERGGADPGGKVSILEAQELSLEPAGHSVVFAALSGQPCTPEVHAQPAVQIQPVKAARFQAPYLWHRAQERGGYPTHPPAPSCPALPQALAPTPHPHRRHCSPPGWVGTWVPMVMLWEASRGLTKGVLWELSHCCRCRLASEWHCSSFSEQKSQRVHAAKCRRPRLSQTCGGVRLKA